MRRTTKEFLTTHQWFPYPDHFRHCSNALLKQKRWCSLDYTVYRVLSRFWSIAASHEGQGYDRRCVPRCISSAPKPRGRNLMLREQSFKYCRCHIPVPRSFQNVTLRMKAYVFV